MKREVDPTDVRIFCEMGYKYPYYNAFAERHISPTAIGSKLGVDEKTVRLRVKKMEEEGFIKYYQADPNLKLFGIKSSVSYAFEAPDIPSKYEALRYFETASHALEIADNLGPVLSAILVGDSEEQVQKMANEVTEKLKLKSNFKINARNIMEPTLTPQKLDWQIIQCLRYNALRPIKEIIEASSITPRMAEYRIAKLLESKVFFIRAMINPERQQGILFYNLVLFIDEARQSALLDRLKENHSDRIWVMLNPAPNVIIAGFFALTPGEPEETMMKVRQFGGIRQCLLAIFVKFVEPQRPNWVDNLIERAIET